MTQGHRRNYTTLTDATVRNVGRRIVGYQLTKNRRLISGLPQELFADAETAMSWGDTFATFPMVWRCRARSPDGFDFWEGLHPEMLEFEERFPSPYSSKATQRLYDDQSSALCKRLGRDAWWDRWQVEPEFEEILKPIPGAIRAFPGSEFFIYPDNGRWHLAREALGYGEMLIEAYSTKSEALREVRKKALGFKTSAEKQWDRTKFYGVTLLILVFIIFETLAYYFGGWGVLGFISLLIIANFAIQYLDRR